MYSNLFSAQSVQDLMTVLPSLPYAIWETFYMTVLSTALSLVIGLPLGVLLVVGEKGDRVYIASEESAIRTMEPDVEHLYAPAGGEPVIVRVKEGAV